MEEISLCFCYLFYIFEKKIMTYKSITETVETYFLSSIYEVKFTYKTVGSIEPDGLPIETMICYLEVDSDNIFELSVQLEGDYINLHLIKNVQKIPYEMFFANYLTTISEMLLVLNFTTKLYIH